MSHVEKLKKKMAQWIETYDKGWSILVLGGLNSKSRVFLRSFFPLREPRARLPGEQQFFCCALRPEGFFLYQAKTNGKMTTKTYTKTEQKPEDRPGQHFGSPQGEQEGRVRHKEPQAVQNSDWGAGRLMRMFFF